MKKVVSMLMVGGFLLQSLPAFAEHYRPSGHHHRRHGYVTHRLPHGHRSINVRGAHYYFGGGSFYRHTRAGYMIVDPPWGTIVPFLPWGYRTVVTEERPYYVYGDTYYTDSPEGYAVAPPPAPFVPSAPAERTKYKSKIDTYDIYIPNDDGSYMLIVLKKVEKGFVGPQGEFYPEHPTVEKLKALYGRRR